MKIYPYNRISWIENGDPDCPDLQNPTNEQLESILYSAEVWWTKDGNLVEFDPETECIVVTFAEIEEDYNDWDQSDVDECCRSDNVYDYIVDCIGHGLHPVRIKEV